MGWSTRTRYRLHLEWLRPTESTLAIRVAPARLTFIDVLQLRIEIDFAAISFATAPFSIDHISREPLTSQGGTKCPLKLSFQDGSISFIARGFRHVLRAQPNVKSSLGLTEQERSGT